MKKDKVIVVGAGLAGSQAALTLARAGVKVDLYDIKPGKMTDAHHSSDFAELVCSNSLKSKRIASAAGLLKFEAKILGAELLEIAECNSVEAGDALAVDRELFSKSVTDIILNNPNINFISEEIKDLPKDNLSVIATGPLTCDALMDSIRTVVGDSDLYFFDAAAPIISKESIDLSKVFSASRYKDTEENADYLNCPFEKDEYINFYNELIGAEKVEVKDFEQAKLFNACMPIESIAKTGQNSMRFGPLKPVGLIDPKTGIKPYACVQLRKEDQNGEMWNLVGFQTRLKFKEQQRVFRMIPGLESAEFYRYGVMHKNNFINSPKLLSSDLSLNKRPNLYFAGQLTGMEGYVPAIVSGHYVALNIINRINNYPILDLPDDTMFKSLLNYIGTINSNFQPMAANFGLLRPLDEKVKDKKLRYRKLAERGIAQLVDYCKNISDKNYPIKDFLRTNLYEDILNI